MASLMSRSQLGVLFAFNTVQNKTYIGQAPMNLLGIQCCQWILVFAVEKKMRQTSLRVFLFMTGQQR